VTKVLIVDDERLVSRMLAQYVASADNRYELVDTIKVAADAEYLCLGRHVDLILMDICTAGNSSGIEAAQNIKRKFPNIKIIMITSAPDFRFIDLARTAGADSFWYKDVSEEELLDVMDRTMNGESIWPDQTPEVPIGDTVSSKLSARELEVLYWIVKVGAISEIAKNMFIDEETVKTHIRNMKNKTGCKTKSSLAIMAVDNRLVLPKY
jgi:DNA-binding NarL/FixJ family response regulator